MNTQTRTADDELNLLGKICVGLFRAVDNVRMFRVGHLITVLTVLLLLAGAGATVLTFKSVLDINNAWEDFDSGLGRRIDILSQMQHHLGYGGLAQHWPAAASGDATARQAVATDIAKVREGIPAFLLARPGEEEKAAIAVIEKTLTAYERALSAAESKVSDAEAVAALDSIRQALHEARKKGADNFEKSIWRLSATVGSVMLLAALFLAVFGLFSFWFTRFRVAKPLEAMNSLMSSLAGGKTDLSVPYMQKSDEVGEMARAVNVFKENAIAKGRMEQKKLEVTQDVNQATTSLAGMTRSLRQLLGEQSSATSSISAATEQLSASVEQVAQNSGNALNLTRETASAVSEGSGAVRETLMAMEETSGLVSQVSLKVNELGTKSEQIDDIVTNIQEIAEQTNLLALNASIEAARAGDAGRGFDVVADEVRKLAVKANASASDIRSILDSVKESVREITANMTATAERAEGSMTQSRRVEEALHNIDTRTRQVLHAVEDIANAAREQSISSQDIARKVETVAESSEHSSHLIGEVDQLAVSLNQNVAKL